ncbi:isovaleryl-CoA dehydrogenase, mitochondrial, partial [Tanacetum coccineum]
FKEGLQQFAQEKIAPHAEKIDKMDSFPQAVIPIRNTITFLTTISHTLCTHLSLIQDCAAVILVATERSTQVALQAIQCLGGNGYVNEYPTGRLLRDAKLEEIRARTSEIRRMIIGRELFKQH